MSRQLSDVREKKYEERGLGSSYLFRVDDDHVVRERVEILTLGT